MADTNYKLEGYTGADIQDLFNFVHNHKDHLTYGRQLSDNNRDGVVAINGSNVYLNNVTLAGAYVFPTPTTLNNGPTTVDWGPTGMFVDEVTKWDGVASGEVSILRQTIFKATSTVVDAYIRFRKKSGNPLWTSWKKILTSDDIDATLTKQGFAADAMVIGNEISVLNSRCNTIDTVMKNPLGDRQSPVSLKWKSGALSGANGREVDTPELQAIRIRSDFIDVGLFSAYRRVLQSGYSVYTIFYDADKNYLSASNWSTTGDVTNTISATKYIRFVLKKSPDDTVSILPTDGENLEVYGIQSVHGYSYLNGKKGLFMGDSITYGLYSFFDGTSRKNSADSAHEAATVKISDYFAKYSGMDIDNIGVRGTGYVVANSRSGGRNNNSIGQARVTDFANYDFVAICYGINDYIQNISLGKLGTIVENTVIGNLSLTLEKIFSDNKLCKVVVYTPYNSSGQFAVNQDVNTPYGDINTSYALGYPNSLGLTLQDYINAIKDVADFYGVPCADLSRSSIVNEFNINDIMIDGLHPSLVSMPFIAGEMFSLIDSENTIDSIMRSNANKITEKTHNLFDAYDFEHLWYVSESSVQRVPYAVCSNYIPVVSEHEYTASSIELFRNIEIVWFDETGGFISRDQAGLNAGNLSLTATAPSDAKYARASFYADSNVTVTSDLILNHYKCMFAEGYFINDYIPNTTAIDYVARNYQRCSEYTNKKLSILGDSLSTFGGSVTDPNDNRYSESGNPYTYEGNRCRYPQTNLLTDVRSTYWLRVIESLEMTLGINDSWAGSRVSWDGTESPTDNVGADIHISSLTRIHHLNENGAPDIILVNAGTNDILYDVPIGTFDYTTPQNSTDDSAMETYLESLPVDTFANAYRTLLIRLLYYYPNSKIVAMLPNYTFGVNHYNPEKQDKYCEIIKEACDYFGIKYFDARSCGVTIYNYRSYLPDNIHYNTEGMRLLADNLIKFFKHNFSVY